ncbi:hypothetical protein LP419_35595 [Massilia sp. H-1]|nr:hypothetical protein LP419_35595 [Massilia sp. H-1]
MHRDLDSATTDGLQVEAGFSRQGGRSLFTLDGKLPQGAGRKNQRGSVPQPRLGRNPARARRRRALHLWRRGARTGARPTCDGGGSGLGYQDFSDGNHRTHGRLRLIVQPSLDLGLTLQARLRTYRSASDSTPRAYFNPARYDEAMLALGFRKRFSGNMASVTVGVGRQRVGDAERTATRLLEASWETPVKAKSSLRLRAGYNRSAAFGGPDYSYRYAQAEWLLAF